MVLFEEGDCLLDGRRERRYYIDMKTISVAILEPDYEAFRQAALTEGRPIAQLIREAMALYRREKLEISPRLTDLPVLPGPRPRRGMPTRAETYDEIYDERIGS